MKYQKTTLEVWNGYFSKFAGVENSWAAFLVFQNIADFFITMILILS